MRRSEESRKGVGEVSHMSVLTDLLDQRESYSRKQRKAIGRYGRVNAFFNYLFLLVVAIALIYFRERILTAIGQLIS
jgi:hypothetical protein